MTAGTHRKKFRPCCMLYQTIRTWCLQTFAASSFHTYYSVYLNWTVHFLKSSWMYPPCLCEHCLSCPGYAPPLKPFLPFLNFIQPFVLMFDVTFFRKSFLSQNWNMRFSHVYPLIKNQNDFHIVLQHHCRPCNYEGKKLYFSLYLWLC